MAINFKENNGMSKWGFWEKTSIKIALRMFLKDNEAYFQQPEVF